MASTQTDDQFVRWLADGQRWERHVAWMLRARGVPAIIPEQRCRPDRGSAARYRDAGDIRLPDGRTLGVKSRRVRFTADPASWPAGRTLMVGQPDYWEQADPKPEAFVIVSQLTEAMLVVPGYSRPQWWVAMGSADQPALHVPRSVLRPFGDLVDYLLRTAGQRPGVV